MKNSSGTQVQHADRLGTNRLHTNSSQSVSGTQTYDAFGMAVSSTGIKNPLGFAGDYGYQEDAETGLKLLGHRLYDPSIGRFLERDPIGSGMNWYRYCGNNPLCAVDADGLEKIIIVVSDANPGDEASDIPRFNSAAELLAADLRAQGHEVTILRQPKPQKLADALQDADSMVYIGHGYPPGKLMVRARGK